MEDLIIHIALKYNSKIKQGTKYIIYWDDKKYTVPDIYTDNIIEDVYKLNVYDSDKIISMKNNTPKQMYKKKERCSVSSIIEENDLKGDYDEFILKLKYLDLTKLDLKLMTKEEEEKILESKKDKKHITKADKKSYIGHQYIKEFTKKCYKNISLCDKKLCIDCGDNKIFYKLEDDKSKKTNYNLTILNNLVKSVINVNSNTLCYLPLNKFIQKQPDGGDMGDRLIPETFMYELSFKKKSKNTLIQENKNRVELDNISILPYVLSKIHSSYYTEFNTDIQNIYTKIETQEKIAKEKETQEKAAQEKAAQEKATQEKIAKEKETQEKIAKEKETQDTQTLQSTFSDDQCSEIENHIIERQANLDIGQEEEDKSPSSNSLKNYDNENNIQDSSEESIDNFENTVITHSLNTQTTNEAVSSIKNIEFKKTSKGPKIDTNVNLKNMLDLLDNIIKEKDKYEKFKELWREELIKLLKFYSNKSNSINEYEKRNINRLDFITIIEDLIWMYKEKYTSNDKDVKLGAEIKRLYDECKDKIDTCNQ